MSKQDSLSRLRAILAELYDARYQGVDAARFYKAQGMADGYMRALCDLHVMADDELLSFVNQEKRKAAARADSKINKTTRVQAAVELV
jgi:hypothetical protein